jgi:hypothetical protein
MPYQRAIGWNQASALGNMSPQPRSPGILYGEFDTSPLGLSVPQGRPFTYWEFVEVITQAQLDSILTQLGLSDTVMSRQITVRTRDNNGQFITRNAYVSYPKNGDEMRRELAFWRRVRFPIVGLRVPG